MEGTKPGKHLSHWEDDGAPRTEQREQDTRGPLGNSPGTIQGKTGQSTRVTSHTASCIITNPTMILEVRVVGFSSEVEKWRKGQKIQEHFKALQRELTWGITLLN